MNKLGSKYWDLFEKRTQETVDCILQNKAYKLRRLSLHITNRCNLRCSYCNEKHSAHDLPNPIYAKILREYSDIGGGVLHLTGGEPTTLPYFTEAIQRAGEYPDIELHLNTNLIKGIPPYLYQHIKRLKVSLDTWDSKKFDIIVGVKGAFNKVVRNLDLVDSLPSCERPTTSITYTLTNQNMMDAAPFLEMYYSRYKNLYAVFFSCYKGSNPSLYFSKKDIKILFTKVVPQIEQIMISARDQESLWLFKHSHDRSTFVQGTRFSENTSIPCYIQRSELTINEEGDTFICSHLFRDGVGNMGLNCKDHNLEEIVSNKTRFNSLPIHKACMYGCNKKLVRFNKDVHNQILGGK